MNRVRLHAHDERSWWGSAFANAADRRAQQEHIP
jgi:hypothetical protein